MSGGPIFPGAAQAGAAAGQPTKPKLIQIKDQYASLKDVIRIYPDSNFNSQDEVVYTIIFRYFKGFEFSEVYSWTGEEGRIQRDQEYADIHGRLEVAGYEFI
jgi:hypothetical protein